MATRMIRYIAASRILPGQLLEHADAVPSRGGPFRLRPRPGVGLSAPSEVVVAASMGNHDDPIEAGSTGTAAILEIGDEFPVRAFEHGETICHGEVLMSESEATVGSTAGVTACIEKSFLVARERWERAKGLLILAYRFR